MPAYVLAMGVREAIVLVVALSLGAALAIWASLKIVRWAAHSDPYGGTVHGTGKLPQPTYEAN
jgi:asparagine N-glycosylation enzyme membrane subunit Stt3